MYELLLAVGGLGFMAITIMGFSHGGGGGGHSPGAAHGHSSVGAGHGHGHGIHVRGMHLPKGIGGAKGRANNLLFLISPLDLFAMALGAGAAGVFLKSLLSPNMLIWAAIGGAIIVDFMIVRPALAFAMKFVSKPSDGLEGAVSVIGSATTKFDTSGQGLVQLKLDGQLVQLLAKLDPAEMELGDSVSKGDEVTVLSVDPKRNTCLVSKLPPDRNPTL